MGADPISLTLGAIGLAASAFGTVSSTIAANRQAEAQARQAEANADTANRNAKLAEEDARQARREGYENKLKKRQEVAGLIGTQRAQQGASGALADSGSFMDTILDSVDKGEADAMKMEQQGFDSAYQKDLEAYNYKNQANQLQAQARDYRNSKASGLTAGLTLLGSAASAGSNWYGKSGTVKKLTDKPAWNYDDVASQYFGKR